MSFPFSPGDIPTAADLNVLPRGALGYAQVTTSQSSITSEVALTGLTTTVDATAGRWIRVTARVRLQNTGTNQSVLRIYEASTVIQIATLNHRVAGQNDVLVDQVIRVPDTAGPLTFSLTAQAAAGSTQSTASTAAPAFILVEDLGPT